MTLLLEMAVIAMCLTRAFILQLRKAMGNDVVWNVMLMGINMCRDEGERALQPKGTDK